MITAVDIIKLAKRWADAQGANEPDYRSSVSRAYYGAYHCALETLRGIGVADPVSKHSTHEYVGNALVYSANEDVRLAGIKLQQLCVSRNKADYNLQYSPVKYAPIARDAFAVAEEIQEILRTHTADPVERDALRAVITAWKQGKYR